MFNKAMGSSTEETMILDTFTYQSIKYLTSTLKIYKLHKQLKQNYTRKHLLQ